MEKKINMYDPNQTECFDPNNMPLSQIDHNHFNNNPQELHSNSMELEYQNILHYATFTTSQLQPPPPGISFLGDMMLQDTDNASGSGTGGSGSSSLPNISYDPMMAVTLPYDPALFQLNLPPQPSPLFQDLVFQSLQHPHESIIPTRGNAMNMNMDRMGGGLYQESGAEGEQIMMNNTNNGKGPKNFVTEKQRRENIKGQYAQLRSLIPNPTKPDRASTVLDAIDYINELKMSVRELKLLVEKKRISKERIKRLKTQDDDNDNNNNPSGEQNGSNGVEGSGLVKPDLDDGFAGSSANQLRSSWLKRTCKDTEVDVRIVDDEVTIKLMQRKKVNCLLSVSRTLGDLQLDLQHVAGGHVGDYYSYLFNSKICEGSSVYASAIANKLIEVVERQYAAASVAVAPTTSF